MESNHSSPLYWARADRYTKKEQNRNFRTAAHLIGSVGRFADYKVCFFLPIVVILVITIYKSH